uniref:Uncharacterized protein n=1 Tax=Opuntia streptacantha TaxID=393608 RepID=A0A7C8ZS21_OPUST
MDSKASKFRASCFALEPTASANSDILPSFDTRSEKILSKSSGLCLEKTIPWTPSTTYLLKTGRSGTTTGIPRDIILVSNGGKICSSCNDPYMAISAISSTPFASWSMLYCFIEFTLSPRRPATSSKKL